MGIDFSPEQKQVITLQHENLLVSAAAGSGKTAVLVERIVQMISDKNHQIDIDRLLVVTFTNAAAGEMRERVSGAIAQKLSEDPSNEHLQRQSALIHNAQITTIDSFCLFLIHNHFQELGIDPAFRVADEAEIGLLRQDVLGALLEEKFAEKDPAFLHCVECYTSGKRETVLEESILSLYRFAMSSPWPEEWLELHKQDYNIHTLEQLEQSDFIQMGLKYLQNILPELAEQMELCQKVCGEADGPYMYAENVEQTLETLKNCVQAVRWDEYRGKLLNVEFPRLSSKKDETVSSAKREEVKNIRTAVKKQIESLKEELFTCAGENLLKQCEETSPAVEELLGLVILFKQKLDAAKRDKNIIDFSDMEHMALQILCERTGEQIKPTHIAEDYQEYFEEIMIDEYQDSNLVQETILQCIARKNNRFMVGDVKQSIYRFRLARPELFMEKYHRFSTQSGPDRRIDLHQNFRSRKEIISSVNCFFEQLMGESLGGIEYDDAAALKLGAIYEENRNPEENKTELLIREKNPDTALNATQQEAVMVAEKIRELHNTCHVTDKKTGKLRKTEYGDIVILLRSGTGVDEIYKQVLEEYDIPCFISSKTGYFSASEISILLQVLRVLDNPLQDIPLFGVLHSVFGTFSDQEIAMLKVGRSHKERLFSSLSAYRGEPLEAKCRSFLEWMTQYRKKAAYMSISELLEHLLEESHYLEYVSALPSGEQRRANVLMLMEKAVQFEQTSFKGLYHFIRYMDQLEKYDMDTGEAATLAENADVVRIMTVHKSKGLEFPICFLSGTGRRMNRKDMTGPILTDVDMGIGTDLVDPLLRSKCRTLRKNILARKLLLDNQAEELRILYVACTRAKEKLILTGMTDRREKLLENAAMLHRRREKLLPYLTRSGASSYLEWIFAAFARTESCRHIWIDSGYELPKADNESDFQEYQFLHCEIQAAETAEGSMKKRSERIINDAIQFINNINTHVTENNVQDILQKKFSYQYPYDYLKKLYVKTTVSELKRGAAGNPAEKEEPGKQMFAEETIIPYLPSFLKKQGEISGSMRGSAVHRYLELLDFTSEADLNVLKEQMQKMTEEGKLSREFSETVDLQKIMKFLKSPLAGKMKAAQEAGKLHREQPFVLGVPASRLQKELPEKELVLVQGIIDVYMEENGELILADYKTDVVRTAEELRKKYQIQLDYYAEALERLTGKKVTEKIIYSFYLECEIPVD